MNVEQFGVVYVRYIFISQPSIEGCFIGIATSFLISKREQGILQLTFFHDKYTTHIAKRNLQIF